jgi:uncharacterized protein (TIGR02597 family)
MKTLSISLIAVAAACGLASAQTAYTTPVGYVSLGDTTVGQPAVKANTDSFIAVPLSRPTEFAGVVSAIGVGTISVAGTPWSVNQFTSLPYSVTVQDGPQKGLIAIISSNTVNQLSVTTVVGNLAAVEIGNKILISKAWTVVSLLPIAGIPNGTQLIAFDGLTSGTNLPPSQIYTKGPSNWIQTLGGSGNADNAILYPGESFILRTGPSPVTSLVVTGEVPIVPHRTLINKITPGVAQDTRLSYFGPVGETMLAASIPAATGDQLIIFSNSTAGRNKGPSVILTKGPSFWIGTLGLTGNQDAFQIGAGVGYLYRKGASAPVGDVDWVDIQSYIPSL